MKLDERLADLVSLANTLWVKIESENYVAAEVHLALINDHVVKIHELIKDLAKGQVKKKGKK